MAQAKLNANIALVFFAASTAAAVATLHSQIDSGNACEELKHGHVYMRSNSGGRINTPKLTTYF